MRVEILPKTQIENDQSTREDQYIRELPYLEQTCSWREGMRYIYSPDCFPIKNREFQSMVQAGRDVGEILNLISPRIIEFRLDFIGSFSGNLFITEVQTDDRGLPAIAIARNARGSTQENFLPGAVPSFIKAIKTLAQANDPKLAIVYPQKERFYYAGFYDLSRICQAFCPEAEIFTLSDQAILDISDKRIIARFPDGSTGEIPIDFLWDLSETTGNQSSLIQPRITKAILLEIWNDQSSRLTPELKTKLRKVVPQTCLPEKPEVIQNKNKWILKPVEGRWSQGVIFGEKVTQEQWEKAVEESKTNSCLAQKFIKPRNDWVLVRDKNGVYYQEALVARIEGYYFKTESGWILADILATLTENLPVHGKRDCVMIPGKII